MAYVGTLFERNFLEYASYVIKDRAIPHIADGLKPVQRRILHSLLEMDDGKFHKVANVVGHCMKYHPHGDASIYEALVVLANKGLFIETQGNFGNIFTGDSASAARYIECRIAPIAREILYRKELTEFTDSYDGRNREPITFPAKVPLVLLLGAEGIAVGMSTRILPHNFAEVLAATRAALRGAPPTIVPDFPTGGLLDVSEYADGQGKVRVRARLDTSDEKRIVIREVPYGTTTESIIASIENAARRGKVKIAQINDFTTESVEIEVRLPRGVYSNEVVDALFAFTECEQSISVNLLVIDDDRPRLMTVTEVLQRSAAQLVALLEQELRHERHELMEKLHLRTLERIFIEEKIYRRIETERSPEAINATVRAGFEPFTAELIRPITDDDLERLLKIPIRRISQYDIDRARDEIAAIRERIEEIDRYLADIVSYAESYLDGILEQYGARFERRTEVVAFDRVDVREAAARDRSLRYDTETGYLGFGIGSGTEVAKVSPYDRVLVIDSEGVYRVMDVPDKQFVGKGALSVTLADKDALAETVFSLVYLNETGETYLKRFRIDGYILGKEYPLVGEGCRPLRLTTREQGIIRLKYRKKPRMQKLEEEFALEEYLVKGTRANGVRLSTKQLSSMKILTRRSS